MKKKPDADAADNTNNKPLTLHPLKFEDALRALLQSEPENAVGVKKRSKKKTKTDNQ